MHSLLKKLKIKAEDTIMLIDAPDYFSEIIKSIHTKIEMSDTSSQISFSFLFVKNKLELEMKIAEVLIKLNQMSTLAICFPKGQSKMQTDLSRDKGWDVITQNSKLRWVSLVSIDESWSAFMVRFKSNKEMFDGLFQKKEINTSYYDAIKKEVYLPAILIDALEKNLIAKDYFYSLAYSHRREYVGYVVEAKKRETQILRTQKIIERLIEKRKIF